MRFSNSHHHRSLSDRSSKDDLIRFELIADLPHALVKSAFAVKVWVFKIQNEFARDHCPDRAK